VSAWEEFARIAGEDGRAALVSVIAGGDLGTKLLVSADGGTVGGLGSSELDRMAVRPPRSSCGPSARSSARPARSRCSWT
jgi:hypothetical protein